MDISNRETRVARRVIPEIDLVPGPPKTGCDGDAYLWQRSRSATEQTS